MTDGDSQIQPIDLAHESDFRLGRLLVRPSTREVEGGETREILEPRVMQVLVALHQAKGVASRDDLIARCWDGRFVGEDAINRVIGRLRRLSELDQGASFTVETIARVGYRLNAVAPQGAGAAPEQAATSQARKHNRRWPWAAALILVVALAGVLAWKFLPEKYWPEKHWNVESGRPFLATLALEGEPAFSPNGSMLAYTSDAGMPTRSIYLRNMAGGDSVRLTHDVYDDESPSWASDNTQILYVARKQGEPCRLMIATAPSGDSHEAARCAGLERTSACWRPGSRSVYFVDRAGAAGNLVYRLDLDSGVRQAVTTPRANNNQPYDVHCSPDGKFLSYQAQTAYAAAMIIIRDLDSGRETSLGPVGGLDRAAWSEDSRVIFTSAGGAAGNTILAFPLPGGAPYQLYASATRIRWLASGAGGQLAVETDATRANIARVVAAPDAPPDIVDAASGLNWSPTYAPDGTLAFLSNRSGQDAIWIQKQGQPPAKLFSAGPDWLDRLQYAPDGTQLSFIMPYSGKKVTVRVVTAEGAAVTSFQIEGVGSGLPTWTPDSKALLIHDAAGKRVARISVADPSQRSTIAPEPWRAVAMRGDGVFATRANEPGIWEISKGPRLVSAKYPASYNPEIGFRGSEILIPLFVQHGTTQVLAQPVSGGPDRLVGYAPGTGNPSGSQSAFVANPKTGEIVYVASVGHDTNIDLLTIGKN